MSAEKRTQEVAATILGFGLYTVRISFTDPDAIEGETAIDIKKSEFFAEASPGNTFTLIITDYDNYKPKLDSLNTSIVAEAQNTQPTTKFSFLKFLGIGASTNQVGGRA